MQKFILKIQIKQKNIGDISKYFMINFSMQFLEIKIEII